MKLYNVPNNTKVRLKSLENGPPGCSNLELDAVYTFKHIDGMYSLCYDADGERLHLPAWSDVEIVP